ncbi:hypothetical protein Cni_G04396 [Canna indica]|uniref:Uncharacterized protein n=1 Tax=Canna indica TaxID=4628 RepID=A0AAQ3JSU7_9LILI|nr:hypothetical protein Cni_G04396 [Canna indica]
MTCVFYPRKFLWSWLEDGLAMLKFSLRALPKQRRNSIGKLSMTSRRCAVISGTGLARTPGVTDLLGLLIEPLIYCLIASVPHEPRQTTNYEVDVNVAYRSSPSDIP